MKRSKFTEQQILGQHIKSILSESGYINIENHIEEVLNGNHVSFQLTLNPPINNIKYITSTFVPDFTTDGVVCGFYSVTSDISKLKEAEQLERKRIIELAHASRLTTMGEMKGNIQGHTFLYYFGLGHENQGCEDVDLSSTHPTFRSSPRHLLKSLDILWTAIGISGIVANIGAKEDLGSMNHFRIGQSQTQKNSIPGRYVGDRNS